MSKLPQRLSFGASFIALTVLAVWADARLSEQAPAAPSPWRHGAITTGIWCILVGLAALEMLKLLRNGGHRPLHAPAALGAMALVVIPWWVIGGAASPAARLHDLQFTLLALSAIVLAAGSLIVLRGSPAGALGDLAGTLCVVVYLGLSIGFAVRLRVELGGSLGAAAVLYYVLVAKVSDMGAYFVGSRFGRLRFAPAISPSKTVEGLMGGLAAAIACGLAYDRLILSGLLRARGLPEGTMAQAIMFTMVIAVLSHVGDLVESAMKRSARAKDSGSLIPGFGGVFDMIDSLIPGAPAAWWLMTFRAAGG